MHLDWNSIKDKVGYFVQQNGVWLQWLQRSTSFANAYDTTNSSTYGYGDSVTTWTTGSCKAIIEHVSAKDVIIEPGFYEDSYERIYFDPSTDLNQFDQIIFPSGSGIRYLVLSRHAYTLNGDVVVSRFAIIRHLLPRSGSIT